MAKFCSNCGAQMEDADKVCGMCGTPVAGATVAATPVAAPASNDTKKKGNNKLIGLVVAVIVAIVAIVVVVNILGNFTGYKGTLNKMTKALKSDDMDTLESLASSLSDEVYEAWTGDDYDEYYEDMVSDVLDKYEDEVGNIKKITYEISDETEISNRKMEDLEETMIENYDMDVSDLKKIVKIDMKVTVKGAKKSATYSVHDLLMVKEGSSWKIFYQPSNIIDL